MRVFAAVARADGEGSIAVHTPAPKQAMMSTVLIRCREAFPSPALVRFSEVARQQLATAKRPERKSA